MDKYEKQQEKEKQLYDKKHAEDFDSTYSNDPINEVSIDYEAWTEFFSYYRYYIDEFAIDILGVDLFPFQRVILRAMGNTENYNICKPDKAERYDINIFNTNMDILDSELKRLDQKIEKLGKLSALQNDPTE